jgi:hypothetical protein
MRNTQFSPVLIGVGLAILLAAAYWPSAPAVTAMAIIALGATDAMVSRFRDSAAALPIMVLHGLTYVLLYSIFVGARLHVLAAATTTGVNGLSMLDLAASSFPMTVALSRIFSCLRRSTLSRE